VEVGIIGGGIIGCAAAAFAAEAGARVTLYERAAIGAGASGRNMGAVQHPFDPELVPLYEATIRIYRDLSAHDGEFRFPDEPAGLLELSEDPAVLEKDGGGHSGLRSDFLAPRQVQSLEPTLADDLWAVRLATGFPIPPHAATAAMAERARAAGASLEIGAAAIPAVENGRVSGVILEGARPRAADVVLVAAGPWSPFLLDPSGRWRPIVATWGATAQLELGSPPHHVLEEARVESVNRPVDDADSGRRPPEPAETPSIFTLAASDSTVTIGSTFLGFEPDHRGMAPLLVERGKRFLPGLTRARIVATRACARPQSIDGRPLVGGIAGVRGLFMAAGHGPWGISCGPATARLVVDAMLDGASAAIPESLDVRRFDAPTMREVHV